MTNDSPAAPTYALRCQRLAANTTPTPGETRWRSPSSQSRISKSFDKLEVELRPFNIVVGSNASGKSNFLDVFRLIGDIADDSLESAIGIRSGGETLRNFNLDDNQVLRIRVETDDPQRHIATIKTDSKFGTRIERTTYDLSIRFDDSDAGLEIDTDSMIEHFSLVELEYAQGPDQSDARVWTPRFWSLPVPLEALLVEQRIYGKGSYVYQREGGAIQYSVDLPEESPLEQGDFLTFYPGNRVALGRPQEVMLERIHRTALLQGAARSLANISMYDFDPRKAQQAVSPTGSRELDPEAANLAVVLREILKQPESKRRLINLVSTLLPFVQDLDVNEFGFGQLITMLTERFSDEGHQLAAVFASDGTIACLALVVALYFQENAVAVFEEPDRHLHPHLAGQVMQMMNEVTDDTQVIVTTHNPELLRHANLEDILLVTRDPDGHSKITRPADSEVVNHFLKNELGVEDLFAQNLLSL